MEENTKVSNTKRNKIQQNSKYNKIQTKQNTKEQNTIQNTMLGCVRHLCACTIVMYLP